ncbi:MULTISPECIES: hypothetical protein [unclassified Rhodococcus (in: high G+C Gram-positive bacteria)]|uniref:hypothetical protein n=1 Tax=unclassified Rhodococcus (in: high G+C Gram-positive bacteria) TaxID=192944 RepID=UPI00295305E0|nr:hypothetical protein [Rhodococcus sp. IEGM 1343]MDV8057766.1 hypothetical protein [Rhodococcus sp. IEGM 1343]
MKSTRLSVIDEIFLRTHRGYGIPIALQGIWRTTETVSREELDRIHDELAVGQLGRRVGRPRIPGARLRWDISSESLPLEYGTDAVDDIIGWADAQADVRLDPQYGPGWRLTAAPVAHGGTVLSLVCSHALADARELIDAAAQAFSGSAPVHVLHPGSDVKDAITMIVTVLLRSIAATARLWVSKKARAELRAFTTADSGGIAPHHANRMTSVIVDVDAAEWDSAARRVGGSANSLFVSVVAATMNELGSPAVTVDIPFRTGSGDANAIGMATVAVRGDDSPAAIRAACKEAFGKPVGAPAGYPPEIVQLLPHRVAAKLTSTPGRGEVLCSNIGDIPDGITALGSHRSCGLATRAIHPNPSGALPTTRMSTYLSRLDGNYTLSLVCTDDALAGSPAELTAAVQRALATRNLAAKPW